ncbi:MAG: zinc ribbon domain-containing protein [Pyrinomonadaceae bacterium]
MFCPSCGLQEIQSNQFCRACGTDLRRVRQTLEKPDSITASAVSARDEIGRAFASRINEMRSAKDIHILTEHALPEIERFLESPEERRLRRIRAGSMVSFIGLGAALAFSIISLMAHNEDLLILAAAGVVTIFVGLALIFNGLIFSVPRKMLEENASEAEHQRQLDGLNATTNDLLMPPEAGREFSSVTEHTTRHLKKKR